MQRTAWFTAAMVGISVAAFAAGKGKAAKPAAAAPAAAAAPVVSPAAQAEAEQVFTTLCSTCHGTTGMGDGAAAAALNPKPRAFSDGTWQASVTDAHLAKVILEGGPAAGKSPLMPPNPQLKSKPEVIQALVAKVRSFKK